MANIKKKIQLLADVVIGNLLKVKVNYDLLVRKKIDLSAEVEPSTMVTLTSYGHRLRHSVHYTLYSLLKQKLRPAKIVLWIETGEFAQEPMPRSLQVLQQHGVEIREYAPAIRSYRKLIPTLREYPDFHHIIVDDDLYYSSNFVQTLFAEHEQHPQAVVALAVRQPVFSEDGTSLMPYKTWNHHVAVKKAFAYSPATLLPIGYGGVFYPKDTFDDEVLNQAAFQKLCPIADDLWFYVQTLRMKRDKVVPIHSGVRYYQIDLIRQFLTRDRLAQSNKTEGQNDIQLRQLLEHYQIDLATLK